MKPHKLQTALILNCTQTTATSKQTGGKVIAKGGKNAIKMNKHNKNKKINLKSKHIKNREAVTN